MSGSKKLTDQIWAGLSVLLKIVHQWVADLGQVSTQENEANQPLIRIAGSLSGEPMSVAQIDVELSG